MMMGESMFGDAARGDRMCVSRLPVSVPPGMLCMRARLATFGKTLLMV